MISNTQLTQSIIDAIPNPIIITNGEEMLMCNKNFLEFFKANSISDFLQEHKCVCELFQDKEGYFSLSTIENDTLWTDYIANSKEEQKVSILYKDNHTYAFNILVKKINDNSLVVFTNITALEREASLKDLAYYDYLTHIYNRKMFDKLYIKELENRKRHGDSLSLIMFDIDHFKSINDTYGHDVGDKVLVALTKLVSEHLRANDIFARWGGEEFLVLLPRTDKAIAYDKALQLRQIIEEYDNQIPNFTVSFGVTQITSYDKEHSALIRVDNALYQAKIKRNDVVQL